MVEKDPSSTSITEDGGGKSETAQFYFYDKAKEEVNPVVSPGDVGHQPREEVETKKSKKNKVNQNRKNRRGAKPSKAPAADAADGDDLEARNVETKSNGKGPMDANPSRGSANDTVNKVDSKTSNVDAESHEKIQEGAGSIKRSPVDGDSRQATNLQAKVNGKIVKGVNPISKSTTDAVDKDDPKATNVNAKSNEKVAKGPTPDIYSVTNATDGGDVETGNVQTKSDGKATINRRKKQRMNGPKKRNEAASGKDMKNFLVKSEDGAPSNFDKIINDGETESPGQEVSANRVKKHQNNKGKQAERRTEGRGKRETKNENKNTNSKQNSEGDDTERKEGESSNEIIVTIIEGDENNRKGHFATSSKAAEINAKKDPESNQTQRTIRLRGKTAKKNATKPDLDTGCKEAGNELKNISQETYTPEAKETNPEVEVGKESKLRALPKQSDAKGQSRPINRRTQQRTRIQHKKELKNSQMKALEGNNSDNFSDTENSVQKSSIKRRNKPRNGRNNQLMKGMRLSSANDESKNTRLDEETETKFQSKDHQESNTDVELIQLEVEKKERLKSDHEKMISKLHKELSIARDLNKIVQDERENARKTISLQMTKLKDLELKLTSMETEKTGLVAELATVVEQLKEEKKLRALMYADLGKVKELELKLKNESAARVSVEMELQSVRDKLECLDT